MLHCGFTTSRSREQRPGMATDKWLFPDSAQWHQVFHQVPASPMVYCSFSSWVFCLGWQRQGWCYLMWPATYILPDLCSVLLTQNFWLYLLKKEKIWKLIIWDIDSESAIQCMPCGWPAVVRDKGVSIAKFWVVKQRLPKNTWMNKQKAITLPKSAKY